MPIDQNKETVSPKTLTAGNTGARKPRRLWKKETPKDIMPKKGMLAAMKMATTVQKVLPITRPL